MFEPLPPPVAFTLTLSRYPCLTSWLRNASTCMDLCGLCCVNLMWEFGSRRRDFRYFFISTSEKGVKLCSTSFNELVNESYARSPSTFPLNNTKDNSTYVTPSAPSWSDALQLNMLPHGCAGAYSSSSLSLLSSFSWSSSTSRRLLSVMLASSICSGRRFDRRM
jgi:hypothetical protein